MRQVMTDVCEKDAFGVQAICDPDRVFDSGVRGMRLVAQSVEEEDIEILQVRHRGLGNLAEIGQIGGGAEAISVDLRFSGNHGGGLEDRAEELERARDRFQLEAGKAAKLVVGVEDVAE